MLFYRAKLRLFKVNRLIIVKMAKANKKDVLQQQLPDLVRLLESLIKCQKFKFEIQDCNFSCLKKICKHIGTERLIVVTASEELKLADASPSLEPERKTTHNNDDIKEEEDLDLTGQPLECTFESFVPIPYDAGDLDRIPAGAKIKCTVVPVKIEEARMLLGAYNAVLSENASLVSESVPLIVLCDGKDFLRTVVLGSFVRDKTITTLNVSFMGAHFTMKELPSLSAIKAKHSKSFCGYSSVKTETEVFCQYNVLDCDCHSDVESSWLTVECQWTKVTSLLESPSADAICKLLAKVVPGEEKSPAFAIYKELLFLKRLLAGVKTGEVVWSAESSDISVQDGIKTLISGVKDGCQWRKTDSQNKSDALDTCNFDSFVEAVVMGKRQNIEFTDHVWTALTECTSYMELKESMEMVVSAIKERTIRPVVLHTNKTALGVWIKRIVGEDEYGSHISLEGIEPLKLLLELGIEKLKKDYTVVFVGLRLATEESLRPLLDNTLDAEDRTSSLFKLHCTLELVLMCKTYLHLSTDILGGFARQAMKVYSSMDLSVPSSRQFQFPVQLSVARKVIDSLQPIHWEVFFKTSAHKYTAYTSCRVSVDPPFHHLGVKEEPTTGDGDKLQYFCTTVNCIQGSSLF